MLETQVPEQISVAAENGDRGELEVYNPENGQVSVEEEEAPVPEVLVEIPNDSQKAAGFDHVPDDSQKVAELASQIEEVPKKSYASIVRVCSIKFPLPFLLFLDSYRVSIVNVTCYILDFITLVKMLKIKQNDTLIHFI